MKYPVKKVLIAASISALFSSHVYADADIAVQPSGTATEATANVDICVVVPEILIFGVGAIGTSIAKVIWTYAPASGTSGQNNVSYTDGLPPFTAPAPFTSALISSLTNGGTGATGTGLTTATLPVYLFSNNGTDVTITVDDISGGTGGGGTADALDPVTNGAGTIPISDFASGDGGSISHPSLTTGSTADTSETNGIVNLADTWTYAYTPGATPVAGTYDARITYIAAQP